MLKNQENRMDLSDSNQLLSSDTLVMLYSVPGNMIGSYAWNPFIKSHTCAQYVLIPSTITPLQLSPS